mgnify:CR=1 FL=1
MWDICSFFFQLCPTFSFCWDICRFSFDYVPHFPFVGTYADFLLTMSHIFLLLGYMQIFFLIMSHFWISVGGFLAFFCICPAFGFLWDVPSPFFAYVLLSDFCGRFPCLFWHMSHLLIPPQNLYQMILICLSTYPVYKFPEQNTLIFLPFRII